MPAEAPWKRSGRHFPRAARLLRSLVSALVVVVGVTFIAFALSYLSPTDAASQCFTNKGMIPTPAELAAKRAEMGLDQPFLVQYLNWVSGALHGDLGVSQRTGRSVGASLANSLPYTLVLTFASMALTLLIAVPIGLYCAYRKGSLADRLIRAVSYLLCSLPTFFLALVLLYFLSVRLHLLPVSGSGPLGLIMPVLSLAIPTSAWYVRQVRTIALEQLTCGYVDGLRSRGVSERDIMAKHVLRNSLVPILSLIGISVGGLLGGSAVIECIFTCPGVGNLAVSAINSRDYTMVQSYALLMALVYLLVNWAIDLLYGVIDPRIARERAA